MASQLIPKLSLGKLRDNSVEEMATQEEPLCHPNATKVMYTDVILEEIFKHSSKSDLLHFRLVNKKWNVFATNTLALCKCLKTVLNSDNIISLIPEALNLSVHGSWLPIKTLELEMGIWLLNNLNLHQHKFTEIHGPHIQTLILTGNSGYFKLADFFQEVIDLLTVYFPNVENLKIGRDFEAPVLDSIYIFDPEVLYVNVVLPSIKAISFEHWRYPEEFVIDGFIHMAINLEHVVGSYASVVRSLIEANKISALKSYYVGPGNVEVIPLLALAQPKLTRLVIRVREIPSEWNIIYKRKIGEIFASCRESMNTLVIDTFYADLATTSPWPNLTVLLLTDRSLRFENNMEPITPLFPSIRPSKFVLAKIFPKLDSLTLQLQRLDKNSLKIYFRGDDFSDPKGRVDSLLTVKTIRMDCRICTRFGMKALSKKFPNVRLLDVRIYKEIFPSDNSAWFLPWNGLECLYLGGFTFGEQFLGRSIDSFFTGFSDENCKNLRGKREDETVVELKTMTLFPSIRDLKNLKMLRIDFDERANSDWSLAGRKIEEVYEGISDVTGRYAFSQMPGLREVVITYDHNMPNSADIAAAFKPISSWPTVSVVHCPFFG